jgi:hypothetical protein
VSMSMRVSVSTTDLIMIGALSIGPLFMIGALLIGPLFMVGALLIGPLFMVGALLIGPLSLYRERWDWEQRGSRYRANEREFANHLAFLFVIEISPTCGSAKGVRHIIITISAGSSSVGVSPARSSGPRSCSWHGS